MIRNYLTERNKFISIKEYIWHKLFNEFTLDQSNASCTGLFNIEQLKWHDEALELAGITDQYLSNVVATDHVKKYNGRELDFSPQTPIHYGASDGCLANLGSMADKPALLQLQWHKRRRQGGQQPSPCPMKTQ